MSYKKIKTLIVLFVLVLSCNSYVISARAVSPEEGQRIQSFIDKNKDFLPAENLNYLNEIIDKLNEYSVLSQEEREYLRECQLEVIRKKLGDAQFEEYKKLIEKRASDAEFTQPERFRLYELEKLLK